MNVLLSIFLFVPIWTDMPNAVIVQDSTVTQVMEDHWQGIVRGEVEVQGWRVQIYSSNNQLAAKQQAQELKQRLEHELSEPVYMIFMQPFWKVRVGNFLTIEEAKAYKEFLLEQYPELQAECYPVRDMILIKQ